MQRQNVTRSFEETYGNRQAELAGFEVDKELGYVGYGGMATLAYYTGRSALTLVSAAGAKVIIKDAIMECLGNGHILISFPWREAIPKTEKPEGSCLLGHYVWRERVFSLWLDEASNTLAFFKGSRPIHAFSTRTPRWKVARYLRGHAPLWRTYEAWLGGWVDASGIESRRVLGFDISLRSGFIPSDCHMAGARTGAMCKLVKSVGFWSNGASPALRPVNNRI